MATATQDPPADLIEGWKGGGPVPPFGVEAANPRNCDLVVQCIPGCRLRSRISPVVTKVATAKHPLGDQVQQTPMIEGAGGLPSLPGMQLHVNPAKLEYVIIDPLHDNEAELSKLRSHMRARGHGDAGRINGVPPQKGTLDKHRMKTLVREVLQLSAADDVQVVKGRLPKMADVDELEGEYLLNPGSRTQNTMPTFESDYEAWMDGFKMERGR